MFQPKRGQRTHTHTKKHAPPTHTFKLVFEINNMASFNTASKNISRGVDSCTCRLSPFRSMVFVCFLLFRSLNALILLLACNFYEKPFGKTSFSFGNETVFRSFFRPSAETIWTHNSLQRFSCWQSKIVANDRSYFVPKVFWMILLQLGWLLAFLLACDCIKQNRFSTNNVDV